MQIFKSLISPFLTSNNLESGHLDSNLDQLPIELVIEILTQLKPEDQIQASMVCRQWHRLLNNEENFNFEIRENKAILLNFIHTINNIQNLVQEIAINPKWSTFYLIMSGKGGIRKIVKGSKFKLKSLKNDEGSIKVNMSKKNGKIIFDFNFIRTPSERAPIPESTSLTEKMAFKTLSFVLENVLDPPIVYYLYSKEHKISYLPPRQVQMLSYFIHILFDSYEKSTALYRIIDNNNDRPKGDRMGSAFFSIDENEFLNSKLSLENVPDMTEKMLQEPSKEDFNMMQRRWYEKSEEEIS